MFLKLGRGWGEGVSREIDYYPGKFVHLSLDLMLVGWQEFLLGVEVEKEESCSVILLSSISYSPEE